MTPSPSFSAYSSELSELVAALFEAAVDGLVVFDADGAIQSLNAAACRIFGYGDHDVAGRHISELILRAEPGDAPLTLAELSRPGVLRDLSGRRRNGSEFPIRLNVSPHVVDGRMLHIAVCHDIGEINTLIHGMALGEARHAAPTSRNELFCRFDTSFRILHANEAYCQFMGLGLEQLRGRDAFRGMAEADREKAVANLQRLRGHGPQSRYVQQVVQSGGERRWIEREDRVVIDADGLVKEYQSFGLDITDRKLAEEHVNYLATHDVLTGCANRNLLDDRIQQCLSEAKRHRSAVTALFIDLDDFKQINDRLGHRIGDDVLTVVVQRLQNCLRETDTLARVGGDEFVAVSELRGNAEHASHIAERMLAALEEPVEISGQMLSVGASIGVSIYPDDASSASELLHHADMAMYQAKGRGGRRFQFFTPAMQERATHSVNLAARLRKALDSREFELHYQPLFRLDTLKVTGIEALLRWNDGDNGQILPEAFLPFAIEHGLMPSISRWVLRQACLDNRKLLDTGLLDVPVSVNMCGVLFHHHHLPRMLERVLNDTALPGRYLELEVTEAIAMAEREVVATNIRAVKNLGVRLSIDDYGTGISSVAQLRRAGFDRVKIDRSFTRELSSGGEGAAISLGILRMADALGLQVVAEGIENATQREFLQQHACTVGQGFWYARPMPFAQLVQTLQ